MRQETLRDRLDACIEASLQSEEKITSAEESVADGKSIVNMNDS